MIHVWQIPLRIPFSSRQRVAIMRISEAAVRHALTVLFTSGVVVQSAARS